MLSDPTTKKIHFIGICGAGMSAVAALMKERGHEITGSDNNFYPPISTVIEKSGITFLKGYKKENLPDRVDVIGIGKHAGLTPEENEEVRAAFASGARIMSFPEVLGEITVGRDNIVVAGSYGKSTCTALMTWCLISAGKDPGYFIGAIPETPDQASSLGSGDVFVLEGDEYPSSNWDQQSKFLHYHPHHLLLTSLAHDHLNVFKTVEDYRKPFKKLLRSIPGTIAACVDGDGVMETLNELNISAIRYGDFAQGAQWHLENIRYAEGTTFDIFRGQTAIISINTRLLGRHNAENILGVGALLLSLGLVTPDELGRAVETFRAPQRRMDKKSDRTIIPIYEGFGSSVAKTRSAIETMKIHYPDRKLVVLFEPYALSWRSRSALSWYDEVFEKADKVFIYQKPGGENHEELTLPEIVSRVQAAGVAADGFDSTETGLRLLDQEIDAASAVLILTSGNFGGMIESVVASMEDKFPKR